MRPVARSVGTADEGIGAVDPGTRQELVARNRFGRKTAVTSPRAMVVTDHPLATRAGLEVLRAGGNACDAALAACAAQIVLEPDMVTMTGCLSTLHRDAATGTVTYCNGSPDRPRGHHGPVTDADVETGRGVMVPGWWAGFEAIRERFGTWSRDAILAQAIEYARDGFEIPPHLYSYESQMLARIASTPEGRAIYLPEGTLRLPYERWEQPALAGTLERFATEGADEFYRGTFARKLVETVQGAGGALSMADLDAYEVRWQEPVRGTYRGYEIVGAPPPDNGGLMLIEVLNLVELLDLPAMGHQLESADTLYWLMHIVDTVMGEGTRQNDPDSHHVPVELLASKEFAAHRFELLRMAAPRPRAPVAPPGSCQVTVVDPDGDVVTVMNSSLAHPWINGLFLDGMSVGAAGGHLRRTAVLPGQRLVLSLCSNMVLRDGRPVVVSGSPAMALLANVVQNLVNLLDFGMGIEGSVHLPRFGVTESDAGQRIELDVPERLRDDVTARGLTLDVVQPWMFSMGSFDGIVLDDEGLHACADPRRAGAAEGL
ncbi:MAG TPA: gamma-glutamyltransferase [Nitriliruptorales bacterium]